MIRGHEHSTRSPSPPSLAYLGSAGLIAWRLFNRDAEPAKLPRQITLGLGFLGLLLHTCCCTRPSSATRA
jgi:hypothetical protein